MLSPCSKYFLRLQGTCRLGRLLQQSSPSFQQAMNPTLGASPSPRPRPRPLPLPRPLPRGRPRWWRLLSPTAVPDPVSTCRPNKLNQPLVLNKGREVATWTDILVLCRLRSLGLLSARLQHLRLRPPGMEYHLWWRAGDCWVSCWEDPHLRGWGSTCSACSVLQHQCRPCHRFGSDGSGTCGWRCGCGTRQHLAPPSSWTPHLPRSRQSSRQSPTGGCQPSPPF